jgi:hypothetical protein
LSRSSSSFLLDWRPSRGLILARVALLVLAVASLWLSALPRPAAMLAAPVLALVSARRLVQAWRRPAESLRIADDGQWVVLLRPLHRPLLLPRARVGVRSGMAWVRADGGGQEPRTWTWWPDTLPAGALRRLRLAAGGPGAHSSAALATMPG